MEGAPDFSDRKMSGFVQDVVAPYIVIPPHVTAGDIAPS
jgi:hypothetical protein